MLETCAGKKYIKLENKHCNGQAEPHTRHCLNTYINDNVLLALRSATFVLLTAVCSQGEFPCHHPSAATDK